MLTLVFSPFKLVSCSEVNNFLSRERSDEDWLYLHKIKAFSKLNVNCSPCGSQRFLFMLAKCEVTSRMLFLRKARTLGTQCIRKSVGKGDGPKKHCVFLTILA